ncbi:MAG: GNAT family N-acetyltransferase, partial [Campylobacteraceae bacterium]|nr:GNAT family N-acetyltransferase [Campylobacteraceae bacterium]
MYCKIATLEDIPDLCILLQQLFSQEAEFESDTKIQADALKMIIDNKSTGEIFIILKEEKIVGMVNFLYTISTALGSKVAILEDMILDKNYRGQNLGTTLIDFA